MAYKILVVDDEREAVEVLKSRLVREGYEVVCAFDGEEALLRVKESDPDLLLLDLNMPKKNGFEVLEELRRNFNHKWRPVIIVSAESELETVKKSYSLEADHYLTKPCEIERILQGISTMISLIPLRMHS